MRLRRRRKESPNLKGPWLLTWPIEFTWGRQKVSIDVRDGELYDLFRQLKERSQEYVETLYAPPPWRPEKESTDEWLDRYHAVSEVQSAEIDHCEQRNFRLARAARRVIDKGEPVGLVQYYLMQQISWYEWMEKKHGSPSQPQ